MNKKKINHFILILVSTHQGRHEKQRTCDLSRPMAITGLQCCQVVCAPSQRCCCFLICYLFSIFYLHAIYCLLKVIFSQNLQCQPAKILKNATWIMIDPANGSLEKRGTFSFSNGRCYISRTVLLAIIPIKLILLSTYISFIYTRLLFKIK